MNDEDRELLENSDAAAFRRALIRVLREGEGAKLRALLKVLRDSEDTTGLYEKLIRNSALRTPLAGRVIK